MSKNNMIMKLTEIVTSTLNVDLTFWMVTGGVAALAAIILLRRAMHIKRIKNTQQNIHEEQFNFAVEGISPWIENQYFSQLSNYASTNVQYLNSTITWATSLFTGAVVVMVSQEAFPDTTTVIGVSILIVILSHFFVRASKGYTNMMRFTSIEKLIIQQKLMGESVEGPVNLINDYHVNWICPLPRLTVFKKVLLELGYIYFFLIAISVALYSLYKLTFPKEAVIIFMMAIAVSASEIIITFFKSPYFKKVKVIPLSRSQA